MLKANIKIRIANWNTEKNSLARIRRQVFIEEQNVPEKLEWDEDDNSFTHFIVTLADKTIATARLKPDGQIGRMAVLAEYRNQGIGNRLLQFVLHHAASLNLKQVTLHAQVSAVPFYKKHGFTAAGKVFYEANIPHQKMHLKI